MNTNLGALARQSGDTDGAETYYDKARGGSELSYNKVLAITMASMAVPLRHGNNSTANLALAKILNGDANGAHHIGELWAKAL